MAVTADGFQQIVEFPAEKHLRVLGLPASGKTRALIERYRRLVTGGLDGRVFIVTYSRDQLQLLTGTLLADGGAMAGPSPVLTYFTLAKEVLEGAGADRRIIEGMEEDLLVRRIVRASAQEMASDFRSIRNSDRFQRELVGTFHLLLQNHVTGERLTSLRATARGRLKDVLLLYARYADELVARKVMTYFDVAWHAAAAWPELPARHPLRQAAVVLVDDFQDVDAGQYTLLKAFVPPGSERSLSVFGDPLGAFYAFRGTQSSFLTRDFAVDFDADTIRLRLLDPGDPGATIPVALRSLTEAVLGEEADLYLPRPPAVSAGIGPLFDAVAAGGAEISGDVRSECVDDEVQECYGVARRIRDLIDSGTHEPSEIAVITNEKSRYEPLLRAAFIQHGVVLDTGRPVQTGFRGFVHALLRMIEAPGDIVATQTVTTAPFYSFFRSHVIGLDGASMRDPAMEATVVREFALDAHGKLAAADADVLMRTFVATFLMPACKPYGEASGDESVFGFVSLLVRRWDEFLAAAVATGERADLPTFGRVSGLFEVRSTAPMPGASEVGFFSAREARGQFFRSVFVLGCSELLFPSPLKREAILPVGPLQTALQIAFPDEACTVHGARTPADHLAEEHHLLYSSLTRGTEQLFVSCPRSFGGQARPAPSSIIQGGLSAATVDVLSVAQKTPAAIRFARAWASAAEAPGLADRVGDLSAISRGWNAPPLAVTSFAVDRFPISKSSLESYVTCPRQFFYQKVLRIRDDDSGALYVGKIYHNVMATLNESFLSRRQMLDNVTDKLVDDAVDAAIKAEKLSVATFFGRALRFHVGAMVRRTIDYDQRAEDDYFVEATEAELRFEYEGFEFNGRADRIERGLDSALTLMDYKTGQFAKRGDTLRARVLDDMSRPDRGNWQVPIYLWGYKEQHGEMPGAFKHIVQQPGNDPFVVTLYVRDNESELPAAAKSNKRPDQGVSYVLTSEIAKIMGLAAEHVRSIFAPRESFARTEVLEPCRRCMFSRVCDRRVD